MVILEDSRINVSNARPGLERASDPGEGTRHMMTNGLRRLASAAAVAATVAAAGLMAAAPAHADTIAASTTCSNPYTGSQAGPSSFDVEIPAAAVVGDQVDVTVSFAFTSSSGYDISDPNSFTQAIATTGTAENPVTVTAGSQGEVPNGYRRDGAWVRSPAAFPGRAPPGRIAPEATPVATAAWRAEHPDQRGPETPLSRG